MRVKHGPLLAFAIVLLPFPTMAKEGAKPVCEAVPLAEPWTSWTQSGSAVAGGDSLTAPRLILGKPVTVTLRPVAYVQYAAAPGKDAGKGQGGLFTLALKSPARVGIALSDAAWVDIVDGDMAVAAVDHGHGPDCSGIRKIVWFELTEGTHIVQIAGAPSREIRVMAADARANQPVP
ncbi:hypothetical protein L485_21560 [Sphingobium baderi LL03]|uniref:Uncharacterized protein n=2 Tax=Sphingobium TaxID=165695 RepID=T0G1A4_9SPHN|nr:hypothetical protein L485_21560 [Sphingobium baderi LL03]TWH91927.1 hypothetical protein IQ35_02827 [Sphingobium wenxiniae]